VDAYWRVQGRQDGLVADPGCNQVSQYPCPYLAGHSTALSAGREERTPQDVFEAV
jgi:hypothetical protein